MICDAVIVKKISTSKDPHIEYKKTEEQKGATASTSLNIFYLKFIRIFHEFKGHCLASREFPMILMVCIFLSHPHTKIIFCLNIKVPEDTEMRNITITLL